MRYATPETVYALLQIDPDTESPAVLAALEDLEEGIAATIDNKCNRTFGAAPTPKTRDLAYQMQSGYGQVWGDLYIPESGLFFFDTYTSTWRSPYVSPWGMRNVTAVAVDGTWDGTVWDDEDAILAEDWRLVHTRDDGWSQGILLPGSAYTSVRVTAEWEDDSWSATVPPEIREAANFILVDEWRIRHQSPAGEMGPPGLAIFIRNVWEFELVKSAIAKNTFRQLVV